MATLYQDSALHGGFHPFHGVSAWFSRLVAKWSEHRRHAREMADLNRFTDRELWDVGLSRSDLIAIERGVYRRD